LYSRFFILFRSLNILKNNLNEKVLIKKVVLKITYRKKLRKISSLIYIRLFKLQLENIIFFTCNRFLDIFINNIFLIKGLSLSCRLGSRVKKQEFRFVFYLLLLSTQYNQSKMLSNYVVDIIQKTKKHHMVLRNFVSLIELFFFKNIISFLGFQLRVTGKLGGKMRKSKYHYKLGKVRLQTLKVGLSYSSSVSYTKFGVISVKV
jgi:hypothetical protein